MTSKGLHAGHAIDSHIYRLSVFVVSEPELTFVPIIIFLGYTLWGIYDCHDGTMALAELSLDQTRRFHLKIWLQC